MMRSYDYNFLDLLQQVDEIELVGVNCPLALDVSPIHPTLLLCASLQSLHILDLTTKTPTFQLPARGHDGASSLHSACFLRELEGQSSSLILTCSGQGKLDVWDFRASGSQAAASLKGTPPANGTPPPNPPPNGTPPSNPPPSNPPLSHPANSTPAQDLYSLSVGVNCSQVALLGGTGKLSLYDLRNLHQPMATSSFSRDTPSWGSWGGRFASSRQLTPLPCVKVCS